jgi:hypothetical protein
MTSCSIGEAHLYNCTFDVMFVFVYSAERTLCTASTVLLASFWSSAAGMPITTVRMHALLATKHCSYAILLLHYYSIAN